MKVAITGGCGYIGSHIAKEFKKDGHETLVIDWDASLYTYTHKYADKIIEEDFVNVQLDNSIDCIIHLAASSLVGPSVTSPSLYYENNFVKTKQFLDKHLHIPMVFSSTSSVYGGADTQKSLNELGDIELNTPYYGFYENSPKNPQTSYGKSKLAIEMMLEDYAKAYDHRSISLRYFNACGANKDIGQPRGATHLVARLMESLTCGTTFQVYGTDYHTHDGTAIRDYTHVVDIARAHIDACKYIINNPGYKALNIGRGKGYSVLDMMKQAQKFGEIKVEYTKRREGDPERVYANTNEVKRVLNWETKLKLDDIMYSAYEWYTSETFKKYYS